MLSVCGRAGLCPFFRRTRCPKRKPALIPITWDVAKIVIGVRALVEAEPNGVGLYQKAVALLTPQVFAKIVHYSLAHLVGVGVNRIGKVQSYPLYPADFGKT